MLLSEIINPTNIYAEGNLPARNIGGDHFITPPEMVGDTTSNEYMPYLNAFRGMSELVEYNGRRALIYKMKFYQYNSIYSKRARGINRDFNNIMDIFCRGGKTFLLNGDVGCEIYAGTILQRVLFDAFGNRQEGWDLLIMLGVKPEYVFNGGISGPVDVTQFCLFVNSMLLNNPVYGKMYKKFSEMIIVPLIQYGVRVVFIPSINAEVFKVRRYKPQFSSSGALVDYKRSFNDAIELGDTVNVDYRYPGAPRHELDPITGVTVTQEILPVDLDGGQDDDEIFPDLNNIPDSGESAEPVSLPGVDGQPFQVTLNAEDFRGDFTMNTDELPAATVSEILQEMRNTPLEIIGLDEEPAPTPRVWTEYERSRGRVSLNPISNPVRNDEITELPF